jgi:hypothetical protein
MTKVLVLYYSMYCHIEIMEISTMSDEQRKAVALE